MSGTSAVPLCEGGSDSAEGAEDGKRAKAPQALRRRPGKKKRRESPLSISSVVISKHWLSFPMCICRVTEDAEVRY